MATEAYQSFSTARLPLVLCADDYGLSPGVSRGIAELIAAGRLTATGCMTASPFWREEARGLRGLSERADVGLHLTLTEHAPLTGMPRLAPAGRLPSNGRLVLASLRGSLAEPAVQAELRGEIEAQIDAFEAAFDRPPDFVDGHHHAHQLPGIGALVIEAFERRVRPHGGWLRVCREPRAAILQRGSPLRALAIDALGATYAAEVRARGIAANDSFRGVRSFSPRERPERIFPLFLRGGGRRPLAMCHPGHVDEVLRGLDPVVDAREAERAYLASAAFAEALEAAGVRLARLREIAP